MKKILSDGNSNAKTKKNDRPTKILYLLPSIVGGKDMCPFATKGCRMACLNTAGRGAMSNVQQARENRTIEYVTNRYEFIKQIASEINGSAKFYKKQNKEMAIRLNGTSDQPLVEHLLKDYDVADNVVFYDYTKNPKKVGERVFPTGHRYVVTLSRHEGNDAECIEALKQGKNVAIVFDELPEMWNGFKVIDGDERDDLMLDNQGVVLGLKAKGKAKKDTSGFVIKTN